jgi:hypothetical protein
MDALLGLVTTWLLSVAAFIQASSAFRSPDTFAVITSPELGRSRHRDRRVWSVLWPIRAKSLSCQRYRLEREIQGWCFLFFGALVGYLYAAWQAGDAWFPHKEWRNELLLPFCALLYGSIWLFRDRQEDTADWQDPVY